MTKRKINLIVVHCSASLFGSARMIAEWHRERGWRDIGYHYVINNGYSHAEAEYMPLLDGALEAGRLVEEQGAHVEGRNQDSLGVCLIGDPSRPKGGRWPFTRPQLETLRQTLTFHLRERGLKPEAIRGHCELDPKKPLCPGINMDHVRAMVAAPTAHEADVFINKILTEEK